MTSLRGPLAGGPRAEIFVAHALQETGGFVADGTGKVSVNAVRPPERVDGVDAP